MGARQALRRVVHGLAVTRGQIIPSFAATTARRISANQFAAKLNNTHTLWSSNLIVTKQRHVPSTTRSETASVAGAKPLKLVRVAQSNFHDQGKNCFIADSLQSS